MATGTVPNPCSPPFDRVGCAECALEMGAMWVGSTFSRNPVEERKKMNIITWIVFGLIAGAIAKFLMPGKDPGG